jgi:predicted Rdx family selenoprotein
LKEEAVSLKNDIERELGTPVRVRSGAPGSLTVVVDGEKLFSRKESGQPPKSAEIVQLIRRKSSAS